MKNEEEKDKKKREVEFHIEEDISSVKNMMKEQKLEEEDKEGKEKKEEFDESKEKKENKKLFFVISVIFLCFIVFIGTFYYYKSQGPIFETYTYNGFEFEKITGLWNTEWQKEDIVYKIHLRYGPREAEDVPLLLSDEFFITNNTYITFDPEGLDLGYVALASTEITLTLSNVFGIDAIGACYRNATKACERREIITCENTNDTVIYVKEDEETKVSSHGNCLIIQGNKEELVRAADKVIWKWYGIME